MFLFMGKSLKVKLEAQPFEPLVQSLNKQHGSFGGNYFEAYIVFSSTIVQIKGRAGHERVDSVYCSSFG